MVEKLKSFHVWFFRLIIRDSEYLIIREKYVSANEKEWFNLKYI